MSAVNIFCSDIMLLIFNATTITGLARDDTSPVTNLSCALHTADPGETGTQSTSETAYTGYSRVNVARTSGGWAVAGSNPDPASVSPVASVTFGECSASAGSAITHFSVGTGVSNKALFNGTVTPNVTMAVGVAPFLKTTTAITLD